MIVYIINLLFILFFGLVIFNINVKNKNVIFLSIVFIILTLMSGFRHYSIGTDTNGYLLHFNIINFNNVSIFQYSMEPLFILLNKIGYLFSSNPQIILILSSIIISFFVAMRINASSAYPWMSVFLYVSMYMYYQSFNGVRQYIAIAIMFYFSKYISENKPINYYFGVVLAIGFHQTAAIFIPFYVVNKLNENKTVRAIFISFLVILVANFNKILNLIFNLFPSYVVYKEALTISSGGIRDIFISIMILAIGYVVSKVYGSSKKIKEYEIYIVIYFLLSVISYGSNANLVQRIAWYFSMFVILYLPELVVRIKSKEIRIFSIIMILMFFTAFHGYLLSTNFHRVTPYQLYFN